MGAFDSTQPPIAAPLLRLDAQLYGVGAPPLQCGAGVECSSLRAAEQAVGAFAAAGGHGAQGGQWHHHRQQENEVELEAHPQQPSSSVSSHDADPTSLSIPHRVRRHRRRVASLLFTDGSSCSCTVDCTPVTSEPDWPAAITSGEQQPGNQYASEPPMPTCCAHLSVGRAALCDAPNASGSPIAAATPQAPAEAGSEDRDDEEGAGGDGDGSGSTAHPAGAGSQGPSAVPSDMSMEELVLMHAVQQPPASRRCPQPTVPPPTSTADGEPLIVLFLNRSPYPVKVAHMDKRSIEVPLLSLQPAEHVELSARTSDAWRVRTLSGVLLLELGRTPPAKPRGGAAMVHIFECDEGW